MNKKKGSIAYTKYCFLCVMLVIGTFNGYTQNLDRTYWYYTVSSSNVKVGDTIEVSFRVAVPHNWYIPAFDENNKQKQETKPMYKLKDCERIGPSKPLYEVTISNTSKKGNTKRYSGISGGFKQKFKITGKTPFIRVNIQFSLCALETEEQLLKTQEILIPLNNVKVKN